MADQPHILLLAFPGQGHINPSLQLAKHFICLRGHVTFATSVSAIRRMKITSPVEGLTIQKGIVHSWIARFKVWPYLETNTLRLISDTHLINVLQAILQVFFLTNGELNFTNDVRRNSLEEAIEVCLEEGLQGIVSEVKGVFRNAEAVSKIMQDQRTTYL